MFRCKIKPARCSGSYVVEPALPELDVAKTDALVQAWSPSVPVACAWKAAAASQAFMHRGGTPIATPRWQVVPHRPADVAHGVTALTVGRPRRSVTSVLHRPEVVSILDPRELV